VIEQVLKGPEVEIGGVGYVIPDASGSPGSLDGLKVRHRARCRWWDPGATTLDRVALIPSSAVTPTGGPVPALSATPVEAVGAYYDTVPLVVGHYWASPDEIELYSPYVACVDYSVAKGGPMVAYRWSGEDLLDASNYVVHHVDHAHSDEDLPTVEDE